MSEAEIMLDSMKTHQVLAIVIVDTRVLRCVTDSLQERRFPSIGPTDYKDTKASIFRSEIISRIQIARRRRARVEARSKGLDEFEHLSSASSLSVADSSSGSSEEGPSLAACISIDRPVKAPVKCQIALIIDHRSATKHGNSVPSPSLVSNDALVTGLALFFFCNNNLNANTAHHLILRDCEGSAGAHRTFLSG